MEIFLAVFGHFASSHLQYHVKILCNIKSATNWKKCPKKGNEECLKAAIEEAVNDLKNGNKQLGMLPLNPLHFERMEVAQGTSSPVAVNLTFYNFDIIYDGKLRTTSAKIDWNRCKGEIEFAVGGYSYLIGDYTVDGKVLVLPIQGKGRTNFTFEDMTITFKFKGNEVVRNGKTYLHVNEAQWIMNPKRLYLWFENLFGGIPALGDSMNRFLNQNWKLLLEEMRGSIAQAMGIAHKEIANSFFSKIPLNMLYTES